ncbi:MAG: hypothetical protein ABI851_14475 [Saprospiraceae bacterium]
MNLRPRVGIIFLSLTIFLLGINCRLFHKSSEISQDDKSANILYFLVFKIKRDSILKKSVIELISKSEASGKLKNSDYEIQDQDPCLILEIEESKQTKYSKYLNHPLYKKIEYVDDQNNFGTKSIILDSAQFFIRLQVGTAHPKIIFSEKFSNGKSTRIGKITI